MGKLPRGLAYLAKLLDDPRSQANLAAFQRFQAYVADKRPRSHAFGRPTALDRARAAEYADCRRGDLSRLVRMPGSTELPAGVTAVLLQIAIRSDCSPKCVREALILIGLEAIAEDLRLHGSVRAASLPTFVAA